MDVAEMSVVGKENPCVSVVMTTFNGGQYVDCQIESILHQKFNDFELIIADDGSSDDTVEILERYAKQDARISLILNRENAGLHRNLETALIQSRGDYIAISDQDDVWDHSKLTMLVQGIGEKDGIFCNSLLIDGEGNSLGQTMMDVLKFQVPPIEKGQHFPLIRKNIVSGHASMFRREMVIRALPFRDGLMFDQQLAFFASVGNGLNYIDACLVNHRIHGGNQTNSGLMESEITSPSSCGPGAAREIMPGFPKRQFMLSMQSVVDICRERISLGGESKAREFENILNRLQNHKGTFFDLRLFVMLLRHRRSFFYLWEKRIVQKCFKLSKGGRYYEAKYKWDMYFG